MNQKELLIIIKVSNPTAFAGKGSIIILEYADVDAAMMVARRIALETGRSVTVRCADASVIGTIQAATSH